MLTIFSAIALVGGILFMTACFEDEFPYSDTGELQFSTDTLRFDTVFTEVGSATRFFKVINASDDEVTIERVSLGSGASSNFRLNVDGVPVNNFIEDIRIPAKDSIYIYAEVTVDPNNAQNPFVIEEEVQFLMNGNEQRVILEAWGQNAIYLGTKGGLGVLDCSDNPSFTADLPYVIYGILFLDGGTLTLEAGTRIHFHGALINADSFFYNDGILYVLDNASLKIEGTAENPVILEGDRLETDFDEELGQWAGVLISAGSTGNEFKHAEIKNAIVGVRVDSLSELEMRNVSIHNTLSSNLLAYHSSKIWAENCLFYSSSGGNNVQLEYGGNYDFRHCTMATYAAVPRINHSAAVLRMSNYICTSEDIGCPDYRLNPLNANFENCIIYGSRTNEISVTEREEGTGIFNYTISNSLVRLDSLADENETILPNLQNCTFNQAPTFVNIFDLNYELDTLSPAQNAGNLINSLFGGTINRDFLNRNRDNAPDLGCYEYQQ